VVAPGYNPVAAMLDKPRAPKREARWLEVPDAALLLEAARRYRPTRADLAIPFTYPLVAALLLTGGRLAEVLGLEVDDVSLDRETVTFRPNTWRRLKTEGSFRTMRLWPQLAKILRAYFPQREQMGQGTLLFPSFRTGREAMLRDVHRVLDAVADRAGWKAGEIRSRMFRHTYAAARLQTVDQGEAVSVYTVSRELGHGGDALVKRVYGHLGTIRHRSAAVEYRVEQHRKVLKERLDRLGVGTVPDTIRRS
jgi:integrase